MSTENGGSLAGHTRTRARDGAGKTANKTAKFARSGRNGAVIPLGAHPANTGGKKGRSGRPKNELRDALRRGLDEILLRIQAKLDDPDLTLSDLVKVADFLARYGLGTQQEQEVTVREPVFTPEERTERVLTLVRKAEERKRRQGDGGSGSAQNGVA